jgi:hypothetical protein
LRLMFGTSAIGPKIQECLRARSMADF